MGTYNISSKELLEGDRGHGLAEWLQSFEGDVSAQTLAEAWNTLAKKYEWDDYLKTVTKRGE